MNPATTNLYDTFESAIGPLHVLFTKDGIVEIQNHPNFKSLERDQQPSNERLPAAWKKTILDAASGKIVNDLPPLQLRGTNFQQRVWKALLAIPYGQRRTYAQIAEIISHPKAARAVGNACGANPIAVLIPCHRVVAGDGSVGGFTWSLDIKKQLLSQETHSKEGQCRLDKLLGMGN